MIVSKTHLSILGRLNKKIIKWAISHNSILADIKRELTKKDDDFIGFIDDITQEEIQAGTQAIKEFCEKENLKDCFLQYLSLLAPQDLEVAKAKKIYEIQNKRDALLDGGLSYKEHTFQTREKDKLNINGAVTNLMLDIQSTKSISEIIWIDSNDEKVSFTPNEFLIFASSVAFHTQEITFKANALKEQIERAQTIEEVEAIEWI